MDKYITQFLEHVGWVNKLVFNVVVEQYYYFFYITNATSGTTLGSRNNCFIQSSIQEEAFGIGPFSVWLLYYSSCLRNIVPNVRHANIWCSQVWREMIPTPYDTTGGCPLFYLHTWIFP
jgi:hypothetical protein